MQFYNKEGIVVVLKKSIFLFLTVIWAGFFMTAPVIAKSNLSNYMDYLKPDLTKKTNLNQAQDRLIKKQKITKSKLSVNRYIDNREIGIFLNTNLDDLKKVYPNNSEFTKTVKYIAGIVLTIPWNKLEPEEANYDFSQIDEAIDWCKLHQKLLILQIPSSGYSLTTDSQINSYTPEWFYRSDAKFIEYKNAHNQSCKMPVPWDDTYLAKWVNFIMAVGKKYDGNHYLHSISITGGGYDTNTAILPDNITEPTRQEIYTKLKTDFKLNQKVAVDNWKYICDLYAKAFPESSLNFGLNPPIPRRIGEDSLDEISNYIIFRYGKKIFLTRQNVNSSKNTFDDYRLLLKFHTDTYTALQLSDSIDAEMFRKITKWALTDGVSILQIPYPLLENLTNDTNLNMFKDFRRRLGFQLVFLKANFPKEIDFDDDITMDFTFDNNGVAPAINYTKELDKQIPASYKIEITFKNKDNQIKAISYHTPKPPTNSWKSAAPITWSEDLKTTGIARGSYSLFLSLMDKETDQKLNLLDYHQVLPNAQPEIKNSLFIGKIIIK